MNIKLNGRVGVHSTGDGKLDGQFGTVLGSSGEERDNFWIVMLDTPLPGRNAIVITGACLRPVARINIARVKALAELALLETDEHGWYGARRYRVPGCATSVSKDFVDRFVVLVVNECADW